ncbi:hypothetical protein HII31_11339 [Pseudocercospora fuligena]|uniref:Uncharacterized protein n=1 Tax=Pseudocercospora fuligena TaxID=685502 RepID=A0A8H6RC14_9PEZI|nr:hypothetical protein HII31_11339 [Pseudocercospora fuligena]
MTSEHDDEDLEPESPVDRFNIADADIDVEARLSLAHPLPPPLKLRPEAARSSTDPSPAALLQSYFNQPRPTSSHRNRSPYSRSHLRSRSSGATLSAPAMTRAHSSPAVHSTSRTFELSTPSNGSLSPSSPMRSPARQRSPLRTENESSSYNPPPRSPSWYESPVGGSGIESIQEDSELDITPRQPLPVPAAMPFLRSSSLRRRPASPLHTMTNANAPTSYPGSNIEHASNLSTASSGSNSPSLGPQRFNEAYPPLHHYASSSSFSSIPSTPTSQRSRSPSITRERKRWSVCGGERRADLDLETIWED